MRLIILLLVAFLALYLVMTQLEQNTPVSIDPESGLPTPYEEQMSKVRDLEIFLQEQADKRMEQVDKAVK